MASINSAFAALDPVIDRMTSYEQDARYQNLETAIVDVALALGWVAATARGARQPAPNELKEMNRLLRSANGANRSSGVELATQLGPEALTDLHELMGHGRREVRNAVASALGAIGDEQSLPYLVAGLHGNSQKASTFRPSVDAAAESLRGYSTEVRARILRELDQPIRPEQLLLLIEGFDTDDAFGVVHDLNARHLLLLDWSESTLEVLAAIDEAAAWPLIRREANTMSGWTLSELLGSLSPEHQLDLADSWLAAGTGDAWNWDRMVPAIVQIPSTDEQLLPVLKDLMKALDKYPGKAANHEQHRAMVGRKLDELTAHSS